MTALTPVGVGTVSTGLVSAGVVSVTVVALEVIVAGLVSAGEVSGMVGTEVVDPAKHLVQMVDVDVRVTVEIVLEVVIICDVPEVIVAVTGQTVVVV